MPSMATHLGLQRGYIRSMGIYRGYIGAKYGIYRGYICRFSGRDPEVISNAFKARLPHGSKLNMKLGWPLEPFEAYSYIGSL